MNPRRFAVALAACALAAGCSSRRARWEYGPLRDNANGTAAVSNEAQPYESETMERLLVEQGCVGCHTFHGERLVGPPLDRTAGTPRQFQDDTTGVVDRAYLVQSILDPSAKVVDGYPNVMPSYAERIDESEAEALAAYLESLH